MKTIKRLLLVVVIGLLTSSASAQLFPLCLKSKSYCASSGFDFKAETCECVPFKPEKLINMIAFSPRCEPTICLTGNFNPSTCRCEPDTPSYCTPEQKRACRRLGGQLVSVNSQCSCVFDGTKEDKPSSPKLPQKGVWPPTGSMSWYDDKLFVHRGDGSFIVADEPSVKMAVELAFSNASIDTLEGFGFEVIRPEDEIQTAEE